VQSEPVAAVVAGEDRRFLIGRESRSLDAALLRRTQRSRRIAVQPPSERRPLEEALQDADVLSACARSAVAPLLVDELFQPFRADRRLEVGEMDLARSQSRDPHRRSAALEMPVQALARGREAAQKRYRKGFRFW
jgi:hypothetical protein